MLSHFLQKHVFLVFLVFLLSGCGGKSFFPFMQSTNIWLEKVHFVADDDMNNQTPVVVDIAFCYNENAFDKLLQLNAKSYFQKKKQLVRDLGDHLKIFSADVIPGSVSNLETKVCSKPGVTGALMFVRYNTDGDHRYTVGSAYQIEVSLHKADFAVKNLVN